MLKTLQGRDDTIATFSEILALVGAKATEARGGVASCPVAPQPGGPMRLPLPLPLLQPRDAPPHVPRPRLPPCGEQVPSPLNLHERVRGGGGGVLLDRARAAGAWRCCKRPSHSNALCSTHFSSSGAEL